MAELHFFTGTMDSGKSTLALQTDHNHAARGRIGRIFTSHDRAGSARVSSRLGLVRDALEVGPERGEMGAAQARQRPRRSSQDTTGTLS